MYNTNKNSGKDFARRKMLFLGIVGVLVVAVVGLFVYSVVFQDKPSGGSSGSSGSSAVTQDDKLVIDDLYEGELTIPKFDIPKNEYNKEKFINTNGVVEYDSGSARLGIDVSDFQGDIDWASVKEAGIDFVMIRAGYRGATKGKLNTDEKFEQNYEGAKAAGIDIGVYFFSQATSVEEAEAEAAYVLQLLQDKPLSYPVVFDWEIAEVKNSRTASATGEQITSYATAFCKKVKMAGYKPAVYFNRHLGYEYYNLETLKDYDFWLAEYRNVPAFYYNFNLWQYSDNAEVQGIEGAVDINICFKSYT